MICNPTDKEGLTLQTRDAGDMSRPRGSHKADNATRYRAASVRRNQAGESGEANDSKEERKKEMRVLKDKIRSGVEEVWRVSHQSNRPVRP